jgi:bifunctional non-homologous end joining protein LigD
VSPEVIEPMLLLAAEMLPEGLGWTYELKLDGYRALAIKTNGKVQLRSRNDKDFNRKYTAIANALTALPDETVVDGEVVALDAAGRPSFSALQNGATGAAIVYSVFDVMVFARPERDGRDARHPAGVAHPRHPSPADPVREAPRFDASLADLIAAVRAQRLEGLVAKRLDSVYEPVRAQAAGARCGSTSRWSS